MITKHNAGNVSAADVFDNGFQGLHDKIIRFNDPKAMSLVGVAPFIKAADADVEHFASAANGQPGLPSDLSTIVTTLKIGVLLYGVLAKYAAAFFKKSISASRCRSCLRNRAISSIAESSSAGIALRAVTHHRFSVLLLIPKWRATDSCDSPFWTRATAARLNSSENCLCISDPLFIFDFKSEDQNSASATLVHQQKS